MSDPNTVYKLAFAELQARLGRNPTPTEALPLHDAYKDSYSRERDIRVAQERSAAAGRPDPACPSRQPAPQARSIDTQARAREALSPRPTEPTRQAWADRPREEATGGPRINAEEAEVRSALPAPRVNPGGSERATVVASAPCRRCKLPFERPARRGRPPVVCEECR